MLDTMLPPLQDGRLYPIALALIIVRFKRVSSGNRFFAGLINILGTFFHEMAHYLVGFILFAKPTGFSLWPKTQAVGGYVLGSVSFRNIRFYNAIPTALAPLLLVVLAYFVDQQYFTVIRETLVSYVVYIFMIVILLENAIPSTVDVKVAFSNPIGVVLYVVGGLLYLYWDQVERVVFYVRYVYL